MVIMLILKVKFVCEIVKVPSSYLAADDVVWRHADLAAVHELAPGQALHRVLEVAGLVHEGRGLSAELQSHRGQVLVGRLAGKIYLI